MKKFLDLTYYKERLDSWPIILQSVKPNNHSKREDDIYDLARKLSTSEYGQAVYSLFKTDNDYNILHDYATKHGKFLEKFFQQELNTRVKKKLLEERIDLKEYFPLYSAHNNFVEYDRVSKYLPQNFAFDFLKISIYNLTDEKIFSRIQTWDNMNSSSRLCEICGNEYITSKFPDWVYYGANGHSGICFECPVNESTDKERLFRLIPQLINSCGFIPNSDFSPISHNFSSRVKNQNWIETVRTIFEIGSSHKSFGSWFEALIEAGVLENNVLQTSRGVKCIAKSGNVCNSLDEQYIDNWLFDNGFVSTKEPVYPKHAKYNASGRRRADWLVNDYYIEYFGLAGDDKYDKKTLEKISLVRELGLKLIALFPSDLNHLDDKLKLLK